MTAARRTLASYGAKGSTVRVLVVDDDTVRVQWYDGAVGERARRTKDWPNTTEGKQEAKAWAKGFASARDNPAAPTRCSLRALWEGYAESEYPHLRARSQALYAEYWRYWERMWGREFVAEDATIKMVTDLRATLRRRGLQVSTIGEIIRTVKRVYRWGERMELLGRNRIALYQYRVAKDERRGSPAEYSLEEFRALLAALDPEDGRRWRAHVALALCGFQGVRQNAALHLQWPDIDTDAEEIVWRAAWDKQGREWRQPIRAATSRALEVAWTWRQRLGYTGPWVLPAGSSKSRREVYSAQSLWACLQTAETRSGVAALDGRAAHGLRRLLAGEVNALTGDATLAMHAIGDTDLRVMTRYLKKRDERVRGAFERLDAEADRHHTVNENASAKAEASQGDQ